MMWMNENLIFNEALNFKRTKSPRRDVEISTDSVLLKSLKVSFGLPRDLTSIIAKNYESVKWPN